MTEEELPVKDRLVALDEEQARRLLELLRNTAGGHGDLCDAVEDALHYTSLGCDVCAKREEDAASRRPKGSV